MTFECIPDNQMLNAEISGRSPSLERSLGGRSGGNAAGHFLS